MIGPASLSRYPLLKLVGVCKHFGGVSALDNIEFEITFYEGVLKGAPNFIQALTAMGDLCTKAGYWQKGLEIDLKLAGLRPEDPLVLYNLACSYALLKQIRLSLNALCQAVEFGYDDFAYMRRDSDLQNLMKDQRARAFLIELEKRKKPC